MSNRETEKQSYREINDTKETDEVPPLAACVKTLAEAVQLSLADGLNSMCLFAFARAIKAFEITNDRRLPPAELQSAFSLWWSTAKPLLPPDADFDEWRFDFEDTYAKTHAALGANSLQEAIRRADVNPLPPQAERYPSPKLKRLIAVCYHLHILQGGSTFFLGVRDAAKILGMKNLHQASARLAGLVRDGILNEVEKGTRKRATRFRFNLPEAGGGGEVGLPAPAKPTIRTEPNAPKTLAKPASPRAPRKPTTYELVARKKAIQDLIKGLGPKDSLEGEEKSRLRALAAELDNVNRLLAGVAE